MARARRIDWPHTWYHVLSRGNERRPIFEEDKDYEKFFELLGRLPERYGIGIWSYVLMGNHYHLMVRTREANLSSAMHWLGTSYTSYFNRRWERSGHLFQGRFKSFLIEEESYLRRLILYIHRNPLRAGMVERLADYPWSSYPCLGYNRRCVGWLERDRVLRLFENSEKEFRRQVQEYSEEAESLLENLRYGLALCSEKVIKRLKSRLDGESEESQKQARKLQTVQSIEAAMKEECRALGLSKNELNALRQPVRGKERPMRDVLIYLIWRQGSYRLEEIGKPFGVGYASVVHSRKRGQAYLKKNKKLRKKLGIEDV